MYPKPDESGGNVKIPQQGPSCIIFEPMRTVKLAFVVTVLVGCPFSFSVWAQPKLPAFQATRIAEDKALIEWRNSDTSVRQISIQQSSDSLKGFRTALTIPDPSLPQNGVLLNRPNAGKQFYRLFVLYPGGRYIFSTVQSASKIITPATISSTPNIPKEPTDLSLPKSVMPSTKTEESVTAPQAEPIKRKDSLMLAKPIQITLPVLAPGKDINIKKNEPVTIQLLEYVPNLAVHTLPDGFVFVQISPRIELNTLQIRFFTDQDQPLFHLDQPKIREFRIEKSNFYRAGWYRYEVWQKGKKTHTERFFIPLVY